MAQVARHLTDHVDGFLRDKRYLILDGDSKFTSELCNVFEYLEELADRGENIRDYLGIWYYY